MKAKVNWDEARELFIARNLSGPGWSAADLARHYGINEKYARTEIKRRGFREELERRRREVGAKAAEATGIDQVERRVRLLKMADELEPLLRQGIQLQHAISQACIEEAEELMSAPIVLPEARKKAQALLTQAMLTPTGMKALGDLWEKLTFTGAGLPKEHTVRLDDAPRASVLANRAKQRDLEEAAHGFLAYLAWKEKNPGGTVAQYRAWQAEAAQAERGDAELH